MLTNGFWRVDKDKASFELVHKVYFSNIIDPFFYQHTE